MLILFCMRGCGRIERPAFPAPSDFGVKDSSTTRAHPAARSQFFVCQQCRIWKLNHLVDGWCRCFCSLPPCGGGLGRGVAASGLPVWTPTLSHKGRGSSAPLSKHRTNTAQRSPACYGFVELRNFQGCRRFRFRVLLIFAGLIVSLRDLSTYRKKRDFEK